MAKEDHHNWDDYLASFRVAEFLVLEQIYIVEEGPLDLSALKQRLLYLNLCGRTVSRYVDRLADLGLVAVVSSCETFVNPIPQLSRNVTTLVRLWRLREERMLAAFSERPCPRGSHEVM